MSAEAFFNHYEANGWMVGRNKMKNWKAAVAQWNAREDDFQQPVSRGTTGRIHTPGEMARIDKERRDAEVAAQMARLMGVDY